MATQSLNTLHLDDAMARLDTATNIMALISDLLCVRRDGDLTLSDEGANGLYDLTSECYRVTRDAKTTILELDRAKRDVAENLAKVTEQNLYERGFREGAAAAAVELAGPEGGDEQESRFLSGVSLGAFGACREMDKHGAEMKAIVHKVQAAACDAFRAQTPVADGATPSPSGPSLTEPVPEQELADLRQGQQSA